MSAPVPAEEQPSVPPTGSDAPEIKLPQVGGLFVVVNGEAVPADEDGKPIKKGKK